MTSKQATIGLVASRRQADRIVTALEGAGLAKDDVSVPLRADARGYAPGVEPAPHAAEVDRHGAGTMDAALALRAEVGSIVIPGAGSFIAAGPLLQTLSAELVAVGTCSIVATLIALGVHEPEAREYERAIAGGRVLVAVHVDEHEERALAKAILVEGRAAHISSVGEHSLTELPRAAVH